MPTVEEIEGEGAGLRSRAYSARLSRSNCSFPTLIRRVRNREPLLYDRSSGSCSEAARHHLEMVPRTIGHRTIEFAHRVADGADCGWLLVQADFGLGLP